MQAFWAGPKKASGKKKLLMPKRFTPIFAQYQEIPIPEFAKDAEAMRVAEARFS